MKKIIEKIFSWEVFSNLLRVDRLAREAMVKHERESRVLDRRLEAVTRATLNGETEWFLTLIKKDPSCLLTVLKECKKEDGK